ncbi:hypothetical protein [Enteractinococcus coprophilus]|uniref:Uncharacterized protein n=1 Tax=Enteractinococcus coprophilus TaxID=1027633 RepID=A0A543AGY3_9MICC|nr:hypothetical protein [Enteractinococcus coprophilus]TQL71776.1 hypothetical protein FB556_2278 [Enteractinococcus coprophilus]
MAASKSPSDDPEFLPLPPGVEIRHRVGADAELMDQLAPLLAAEGIDVAHLTDADPEELNEALTRAVERHNMELSTPVGDQRARAINTLRELVVALHAENIAEVQNLFGSIGPAPTRHRPSSGHLTGVAMENLDSIYRNTALHPALHVVEIPKVDPNTKAAAEEILGLAAKGTAFRSLDTLLTNHGGFEVARAGIYLLAATITAIATHQNATFDRVLDELVPVLEVSQLPTTNGDQTSSSQEYLDDFASWLKTQDDVAEVAPKISIIFNSMIDEAAREDIDPHDPADFDVWTMAVLANTQPQYVVTALEIIKHYLQFRLRTDLEPDRWHQAHAKITDMTVVHKAPPWDFEKIFATAQDVDHDTRYDAMRQLPIVSGTQQLRDWLATPRPTTDAGAPRTEDVHTIGAMIGLDVHDSLRLRKRFSSAHVDSALDVPELMIWWWTLEELGVIALVDATVELGPTAGEYVEAEKIPFEAAEGIIATYIKIFLIHGLEHAPLEVSSVGHTLGRLLNSLAGMPPATQASPDDFRGQLVQQRSDEYLRSLHAFGMLGENLREPEIPEPLRGAVFYGLMMAMDYMDEFLDQNFS